MVTAYASTAVFSSDKNESSNIHFIYSGRTNNSTNSRRNNIASQFIKSIRKSFDKKINKAKTSFLNTIGNFPPRKNSTKLKF